MGKLTIPVRFALIDLETDFQKFNRIESFVEAISLAVENPVHKAYAMFLNYNRNEGIWETVVRAERCDIARLQFHLSLPNNNRYLYCYLGAEPIAEQSLTMDDRRVSLDETDRKVLRETALYHFREHSDYVRRHQRFYALEPWKQLNGKTAVEALQYVEALSL